MFMMGAERKLLPASVIAQYAKVRAEEIEGTQGYKPGRKQMREIRDEVTDELLPRAFSIRRATAAWVDMKNGWMVVDASGPAKADELIELLRKTDVAFAALLPKTRISPVQAMTSWLAGDALPGQFTMDRDCELRSRNDQKTKVRYANHALESEEIVRHVGSGKEAIRLAMTWSDRISFVLDENLQVRKLSALDILKEESEGSEQDSDFVLMSGELSRMIPDLIGALGGFED